MSCIGGISAWKGLLKLNYSLTVKQANTYVNAKNILQKALIETQDYL